MNKRNSKIGIVSSIVILIGCLFKAFHFPGAAMIFVVGFLMFSIIFIPIVVLTQIKNKNFINGFGAISLSLIMLGILFKIMQWPYSNFLISWSVTISLFVITPLHIINTFVKKINNKYTEEKRLNDLLIGCFIFAILSMWYVLLDLSSNPYNLQ